MKINYMATLPVLRELYEKPRNMDRFRWYLQQMLGEDEDGELDVVLPITNANPMGRKHCLAAVKMLLASDADRVGQAAFEEAAAAFTDVDQTVRATVTLLDDAAGGWTNRYLTEASFRMSNDPRTIRGNQKRGIVLAIFWSSEFSALPTSGQTENPSSPVSEQTGNTNQPVSEQTGVNNQPVSEQTGVKNAPDVRVAARSALYRFAHLARHGPPRTLQQIMAMDGVARAFAGERPRLDAEEIAYTTAVLAPLLESTDFAVQFACLFGDEAARSVGYTPQGISPYAGFEVALQQARQQSTT